MKKPCYKQRCVAIIINGGKVVGVGENLIDTTETSCPRVTAGCETGEGYEICRDVCNQSGHAEVEACKQAGSLAKGGTLHLYGHTYACDDCIKTCKEYGIGGIIIEQTGKFSKL